MDELLLGWATAPKRWFFHHTEHFLSCKVKLIYKLAQIIIVIAKHFVFIYPPPILWKNVEQLKLPPNIQNYNSFLLWYFTVLLCVLITQFAVACFSVRSSTSR